MAATETEYITTRAVRNEVEDGYEWCTICKAFVQRVARSALLVRCVMRSKRVPSPQRHRCWFPSITVGHTSFTQYVVVAPLS
eukprot:m.924333 g.924333  ORF g.924333 m.924333 type:complete len:82 (-) comp23768_c0_seq5:3032-3277(-)